MLFLSFVFSFLFVLWDSSQNCMRLHPVVSFVSVLSNSGVYPPLLLPPHHTQSSFFLDSPAVIELLPGTCYASSQLVRQTDLEIRTTGPERAMYHHNEVVLALRVGLAESSRQPIDTRNHSWADFSGSSKWEINLPSFKRLCLHQIKAVLSVMASRPERGDRQLNVSCSIFIVKRSPQSFRRGVGSCEHS